MKVNPRLFYLYAYFAKVLVCWSAHSSVHISCSALYCLSVVYFGETTWTSLVFLPVDFFPVTNPAAKLSYLDGRFIRQVSPRLTHCPNATHIHSHTMGTPVLPIFFSGITERLLYPVRTTWFLYCEGRCWGAKSHPEQKLVGHFELNTKTFLLPFAFW